MWQQEGAEQGCGWCWRLSIKNRLSVLQVLHCVYMPTCICKCVCLHLCVNQGMGGGTSLQLIPIKVLFKPPPCAQCPRVINLQLIELPRKHKALIALTRAFKEGAEAEQRPESSCYTNHLSLVGCGCHQHSLRRSREWENERCGSEWRSAPFLNSAIWMQSCHWSDCQSAATAPKWYLLLSQLDKESWMKHRGCWGCEAAYIHTCPLI